MTSLSLAILPVLLLLCVTSLGASSADVTRCPAQCRCSSGSEARPTADCSGRQLTDSDLHQLLADLDPETSVLDLRRNQLTTMTSGLFEGSVHNLSVLLLDNNLLSEVEPHAFRGLQRLTLLSLTNNSLTTIRGNAFSFLSGDESTCSGSLSVGQETAKSCRIDLSLNDITLVERQAFAWIKRLEVVLGRGRVPLTVDAYAFYGARWMPRFSVSDIPTLTLRARIFTNTENVDVVEIANTSTERLDRYVFEGLNDVKHIALRDVKIGTVESCAFSGIQFRKPEVSSGDGGSPGGVNASSQPEATKVRQARYARTGGQIDMTRCTIQSLQSEVFRDANVAHITMTQSTLEQGLGQQAFRGLPGLHSLIISSCQLGHQLTRENLASLRGLRQLHLLDNDVDVIEPFAFRDVTDIDELVVRFRADGNVTLMTEAFAHVTAVGELELSGGHVPTGSSPSTSLQVDVGAFRNLVDVTHMRLVNLRLPVLRRHTFGGLSRVIDLSLVNCGVTSIESDAFSDSASGQNGAVGRLDLATGNDVTCDCSTAASLQRLLERTFTQYSVPCSTHLQQQQQQRSFADISQVAPRDLCAGNSAATSHHHAVVMTSLAVLGVLRLLLLLL